MARKVFSIGLMAVALLCGRAASSVALDVVWDGGNGEWNDANWNGGQLPLDLVGRDDGARRNDVNFLIGSGAVVEFDHPTNGDFHVRQGSTLTITDGAMWTQNTLATWPENGWTELDASQITLDNGTFRRTGDAPLGGPGDPFSGGVLTFGSWMADDNYANGPEPPANINVLLTNGGRIENEGQLWFGSWGDQPPGLSVTMTINNGAIDLTGGVFNPAPDAVFDGDLAFTYDSDDQGVPHEETYTINFTGPGSITVDNGIVLATREGGTGWTGGGFQSYEELWNRGILQANGQSGLDGATFGDFFSVTGTPLDFDYMLTSLVTPAVGLEGDYNGNGQVEQGDLDFVLLNWGRSFETLPDTWTNGRPTEGIVDQVELDGVLLNWGNMAGLSGAAGVPEPATWLLACLAIAGLAGTRARRQG